MLNRRIESVRSSRFLVSGFKFQVQNSELETSIRARVTLIDLSFVVTANLQESKREMMSWERIHETKNFAV
jgi:hypothetical protein